ncbi:uncharacterized protein [Apostichopus japonicus]|uniref:uncharacterized protein n=1 Tax=Stichopus japonicus TaxID=307972 RepID=UPI003AB5AA85
MSSELALQSSWDSQFSGGDPSCCNCNKTSQRQPSTRTRGRAGAGCPCKGLGAYCNSFCTCGTKRKACQNKPTDLSDTSDSEVSPNEHAAGEDDSAPGQQNVASNENEFQIQMYVQGLSREQLEQVAVELLSRNPDAHSDLTAPNQTEEVTASREVPSWCKCLQCVEMLTDAEKKCCTNRVQQCVTYSNAFSDICLNAHILGVNMRMREDDLALEENRTNRNYRHYAYTEILFT